MPDERGYIEVERANGEAARLHLAAAAPDYIYDRDVRLRVGEVIARAVRAAAPRQQKKKTALR
jgi:hypothetical protein